MNAETKEIYDRLFNLYQFSVTRDQLDRAEVAIKEAISNSESNLADKYLLVKDELNKLDGKFDSRFDRLADKLEQKQEQKFSSIDTNINERLNKFEDRLDTSINERLNKFEAQMASDIQKFEARMTTNLEKLESKLSKQTDKIDKRFHQIMFALLTTLIGIIGFIIKESFLK
ncbi:hypothetical protein HWA77_16965 [Photobacterium damselae subsp. damselae]|uniref:DUF1640 domain-containing protein n=1 Tax=Photobacterium damselae subsp. damselae TaxID=85581 RepID=A0A850QZY3_PHODD|nr:hypothetical protein [Photobacterium damselae]NVP01908.1 hypothetical protein [Photobacterium damselae subsp. damselae]